MNVVYENILYTVVLGVVLGVLCAAAGEVILRMLRRKN
jgi:hypothetical protein